MTLLVTGGLGFVGSHFVRAAIDRGHSVIVLDDGSAGTRPALPKSVEVVLGDVGDRTLVAKLLERSEADAIVHFAGKIQVGESVLDPSKYFDHNLVRGISLLESARAAGLRRFVFSSTAAVYGEPEQVPVVESARTLPVNPYGAAKLALEMVTESFGRAYGVAWAALRYFNATGAHPDGTLVEAHRPETHLVPLALDAGLGRIPPLTLHGTDYATRDGSCVRDYIHVCDLAEAHLLALDALASGVSIGPLNLGTGAGYTVKEVIDVAGQVLGKAIPHSIGPRRDGDAAQLVADSTRASTLLGWKPRRSDLGTILEDSLRSRR